MTTPHTPSNHGASRLALINAQVALGQAIHHLQRILNKSRTATESWNAEQAAREWLESIGSEPD